MQTITQIIEIIKSLNSNSFVFSTNLEPLLLLNQIPEDISDSLNSDDFVYHLNQALDHMKNLNNILNDLNPKIKKHINSLKPKKSNDRQIPYADFTIDEAPIFKREAPVQLSFADIQRQALEDGRPLKPINRRTDFSFRGVCPFCGAPHEYIYDNTGKGTNYLCKACMNCFSLKTTPSDEIGIFCPHCGCALDKKHDRKGFIVYACPNKKCSHFIKNKNLVANGEGEHLKTSSGNYLLHYHYREFKFNMDLLRRADESFDTSSLSRIHFNERILGLALTYYVNYGLSSRKTALILKQVHGIKISHQTVINYSNIVSKYIKPLIDRYTYKLGETLSGDETYIKIRGKNHYVFFWSDPVSKIITSYTIYPTRSTFEACQSINDCLAKYESIPDNLTLITDANPIYNAAQLFFHLNGIDFDLHQVVGVKNNDEESKKYRPFKQIEERLNRTYKENYYGTNGYDNIEGANSYMTLFVCFFNFLREHSSLGYKTPVDDNLFADDTLMPDKWLQLIEYSTQYHLA